VKVYTGENVRNVAVVGHGHAGKTSLISAALFTAGATQRLGRVDDGTATTDYDEEEISRKMSISAGLACAEWGQTKINFIDTPGFNMFVHEAKMALPVIDAAIVVVDGSGQIVIVNYYSLDYRSDAQNALSQALNHAVDAAAEPYHVTVADGFVMFQKAAEQAGGDTCGAGLLTVLAAGGCGSHPSVAGQVLLAQAVEEAIRK